MPVTNMTVTINGGISVSDGLPAPGSRNYSQMVGFGDSGIDTGYYFTHPISGNPTLQALYQQARVAGGGLPVDPGYAMNTTLIGNAFGLSIQPIGLAGGTNYAASGATVTGNLVNSNAPSIVSQVDAYLLENRGVADPNAMYYISGGGNSVKVAQGSSGVFATQAAYMVSEAHSMSAALQKLWDAGARNLVINNLNGGTALSTTFNATLVADLEAAKISFIIADDLSLINGVIKTPSAYGITNTVTPPANQNPYDVANGGSSVNPGSINQGWARFATHSVSADAPNTYLWSDDQHLSAAGHRIEANYTINAINNAQPHIAQTLTATPRVIDNGVITASPKISYQWQREVDGQSIWTDIVNATQKSYIITSDDVGSHLRVVSTYQAANGTTSSAVSASTLTVSADMVAQPLNTSRQQFHDTGGSDIVHGGPNLDTVIYNGAMSSFQVTAGAAVSSSVVGSGTDHLGSVERLQFNDGVIALDVQGNAGNAYRLYQAAFDRTPDKAGLSFWVNALDKGTDIFAVAQGFVNAAEFKQVYGTNPTNAHIVDLFYQNVLGRAGEKAGIDFWVGKLDGGMQVSQLLQGFAVSSENVALVAPIIAQGIVLDQSAFLV